MTISRAQVYSSSRSCVLLKLTADKVLKTELGCSKASVNSNPGLKANQIITVSSKEFFCSFCFVYWFCDFIKFIFKLHNLIAYIILVSTNIYWTKLPNLPNNGFVVFHFPAMWLASLKKPYNLIGFALRSYSHWLRKRCNLQQKIVRFMNKSHCWEPITLQG